MVYIGTIALSGSGVPKAPARAGGDPLCAEDVPVQTIDALTMSEFMEIYPNTYRGSCQRVLGWSGEQTRLPHISQTDG